MQGAGQRPQAHDRLQGVAQSAGVDLNRKRPNAAAILESFQDTRAAFLHLQAGGHMGKVCIAF
jgi:hypothetical protein